MLSNFRLGARLGFVFAAIIIIFVAVCIVVSVSLGKAESEVEQVNNFTIAKATLTTKLIEDLLHMRIAMRDLVFRSGEGAVKAGEATVKYRDTMLANVKAFEKLTEGQAYENEAKVMNDLKTELVKVIPFQENLIRHGIDNNIEASIADLDQVMAVLFPSSAALEELVDFEHERVTIRATQIAKETGNAKFALVFSALGAVILAVIAGFFVTRSITVPTKNMLKTVEALADGDLSQTIAVESKDEIGMLQAALARMSASLAKIIGEVNADAQKLATSATGLSGAAQNVRKGSEMQSDAASSMASALEQMSTSISHVSTLSDDARQTSIEAGKSADSGSTTIHSMVNEIRYVAEAIGDGAAKAQQLGKESERISTIIHVIRDVADQTNLLALNAAIEAARAGEQGRGFAVVADEVRKLAEKTTSSAQEITEMVNSIQAGSDQMTAQMDTTSKRMQDGIDMAQKAGSVVGEINTSSQTVVRKIDEVSVALKEQASASHDVAGRVEQIVQMVEENSSAVSSVADSAEQLNALAATLKSLTEHFRLPLA